MSEIPTPRVDVVEAQVYPAFLKASGASQEFASAVIAWQQHEKNARTLERELAKAKDDFFKAIENAGPCGACAEIIACGSAMHPHKDCIYTERDRLERELAEMTRERDEACGAGIHAGWIKNLRSERDSLHVDLVAANATIAKLRTDVIETIRGIKGGDRWTLEFVEQQVRKLLAETEPKGEPK